MLTVLNTVNTILMGLTLISIWSLFKTGGLGLNHAIGFTLRDNKSPKPLLALFLKIKNLPTFQHYTNSDLTKMAGSIGALYWNMDKFPISE